MPNSELSDGLLKPYIAIVSQQVKVYLPTHGSPLPHFVFTQFVEAHFITLSYFQSLFKVSTSICTLIISYLLQTLLQPLLDLL